jgi:Glutamate/Leucine/Phenylalanine/Valine dehydrogenase/Recombinase zinc beta ribbon domain
MRGAGPGGNNGGGRKPSGHHLFTHGLLRCGQCGDAMAPRTLRRRNGREPLEQYLCLGRYKDQASCAQMPVERSLIDDAMLSELTKRYLDVEATQERLRARMEADAALAAGNLADVKRDLTRAEDALQRVKRDYLDWKITADDWSEFRDDLTAQRDAAAAAAEQARQRTAMVTPQAIDVEQETLKRLSELRDVVLGKLDAAPDLDAVRNVLRQLFRVVYYQPANVDHWSRHIRASREAFNPELPAAFLEPHLRGGGIPHPDLPMPPKRVLPLEPVGAISEPNGLRNRYGDRFVHHAGTPARAREELFELGCDVLVPGARPDSITPGVAQHVRCAVIAPAANAPYEADAIEVLHRRGIIGVPDFVANAGGVHLYVSVTDEDTPDTALAAIEQKIREAVAHTLATAEEHAITPIAAALEGGRAYLAQATGPPDEALDELFPGTPPIADQLDRRNDLS